MSLRKMPVEIVSLLVELLDVDDVVNVALSCRFLRHRILQKRWRHIQQRNFPRAFWKLAKRRMAVRAADPWMAAIVAMADYFVYTNGHLCYTIDGKQLRVLNTLDKKPTFELTVDVTLLLKAAVRNYDPRNPHIFQPLYYAEGILSCLATQIFQDSTTRSWLLIFELREPPRWVVVQRPDPKYPPFVRNDKDYLFWGSKSHTRLDGSYRWGIHCLNLQTHQWADSQLILWDLDGESIGSDICFEIIDSQFYCVSNTFKTEAEDGMRNNFYQAVWFPVDNAVHDKGEMPPMRNLWRLHDSEGAVDERWTSLQLTKDEKTGNLFIIETRKEWFPGNAGSQRTCYRKELHFETQAKVPRPEHSLHTPLESAIDSLEEEEWRSEDHIEERSSEKIHIGDGPSDATAYTLEECFVLSYNTSCNAFVDLVYEGDNPDSRLQLRVQPMKQEPSVRMWPRDQEACHPHNDLAQLQSVVSPIQPIREIGWFMDERILVYSPTHMASGQLRPVILISFDPEPVLPGFPNYLAQIQDSNHHSDATPLLETRGEPNGIPLSSNQDINEPASPGEGDPKACANFVRSRPSLYQTMSMGNGDAHGFDLSYPVVDDESGGVNAAASLSNDLKTFKNFTKACYGAA
ncbi:hypothetical protein FOPG_16658 [Fusarium oxysporum f. sp. conglutinans race 2 54008]|uniref:F-box domain-containing protein n=1 Tax=Fusarium oxysporum f. sp. conglutinans race 2 54008 TaxID=1089457 RepID=X0H5F0_FUSOX|nr:hypothetical protein FOPG_16658 [Fusarium oxysporum f. sp. conglutinans race 2 54008]